MPPKNFRERSDKLKLAAAFCNVFGGHFAGNRGQLPVTCVRKTTIASYRTSRFIEGQWLERGAWKGLRRGPVLCGKVQGQTSFYVQIRLCLS